MRSKVILSIIAFLAAFGISVALTPRQARPSAAPLFTRGCAEKETARKITNLLSQDIENGRTRDRKINDFEENLPSRRGNLVNFAAATNQYADASASIDDSDLPHDFKTAWREHMKAWRNHSDFLNEVKDVSPKRDGFGSGSEFSRKRYSEQNKEISDTWFEVLRIARTYNAYIPAGAY